MNENITEYEFQTGLYNKKLAFNQDLFKWCREVGYPIKTLYMYIGLLENRKGE
jgi:hypothetical protein